MNLDVATVEEDDDIDKEPLSCFCFLFKRAFMVSSWKPLTLKISSFMCLILSVISMILFIVSLILSFQTSGYPTHSSSTPGVATSFISFIICMYCCYVLYYLKDKIYHPPIISSNKSFCLNLFFLIFLCLTSFITLISGLFINPLCLWYTFGSITGFISTLIFIISLIQHGQQLYLSFNINDSAGSLNIDNTKSINASSADEDRLFPPPKTINKTKRNLNDQQRSFVDASNHNNNNNNNNHINKRKCFFNRDCCIKCCIKHCCLRCCCPLTLCSMALLIVIQACYSANSPKIEGNLYTIKYDGYSYNLQAICKGIRSYEYNFTIILSHGGGANSVSLQKLQNYLSNDYRVCVYTRPGYAWSDAAPFEQMGNMNNTVNEMIDIMDKQLNEYGPYIIIGHSVGGQIAKNVALFYPDKVIGIILLDSVPDFKWQMIFSNGTYQDAVDVFNSRMYLLSNGRFLTPFGLLRPFLGNQHEFGEYQKQQYWAINLDSEWNSQWIAMNWQSQHYQQLYAMENHLLQPGILGNISLLSIPAGIDENCTQASIDVNSGKCHDFERTQRQFYEMHITQKNASLNGEMIICPYPCSHSFAWDKVDWIYETITPFLHNITS